MPAATVGDLVFLSGTGPVRSDGSMVTGKVAGGGLDLDRAREAARLTGLQILRRSRMSSPPRPCGAWSRCSGWSATGRRSAVGMAELAFDIPVEIEAIVQVG